MTDITEDGTMALETVTRVEIIDSDGRAYEVHNLPMGVVIRLQDDQRTLKIFTAEEV